MPSKTIIVSTAMATAASFCLSCPRLRLMALKLVASQADDMQHIG